MDESDGQVSIKIGVMGSLQKEVVVSFSTTNITAVGKFRTTTAQHTSSSL